ncbi:DoxX family protein [Sphaerimonospora thailandensis]|uniref:Membrane protein YphA (DoxX/SURF4 family) n=1 Tax=Sphaerimonospora thailandensis TaxID=795644 RepID=A0A8J3VZR5_9ACTN|nr:DoxX family protein [Sphaerimonospora thailandensis]GIH70141.1 hypothetical protein Mth01_23940 [Sphaerimonospora thailandensis]
MKRSLQDLATLAARLGVGGIFFVNGWHKLEAGLTSTGAQFAELQAPMPGLWAAATMLIELVGGTLLIAGLAVPAVGLLLFAEALAVFVLTAGDTGLPLTGGDVRLIVALGAASVLLSVTGGGRASVDHMVVIKRRESGETDGLAADTAADTEADTEADAVIAALRGLRDNPGESRDGTGEPRDGTGRPGDEEPPKSGPAKVGPAKAGPAKTEAVNDEPGAGEPPQKPRTRKNKRADGEATGP